MMQHNPRSLYGHSTHKCTHTFARTQTESHSSQLKMLTQQNQSCQTEVMFTPQVKIGGTIAKRKKDGF